MSRSAVIVLRILAVGSALTILACQIANRQKQAESVAGDRGATGSSPTEEKKPPRPADSTWAAGSKSAMFVTPDQLKSGHDGPAPVQAVPTVPPPPIDPGPVVQPPPPNPAPPAPPARIRGFGSKSAPLVTPSDLRQLRQQSVDQSAQQPRP